MNLLLAILGGLLGLIVTGVAVYSAWNVHQLWKQQEAEPKPCSQAEIAAAYFSRWTMMDYAIVVVFLIGFLLLLTELLAFRRDQAAVESFHFAYLLTGMILSAMGMLLLFVRLIAVLGFIQSGTLYRTAAVAPDHQNEPNQADPAE